MNIRDIAVSRLKEYENNPRNNDLAVEKVKYSIQRFGFLFPVVVDVNYVIVAGHTRVRACRELGITSVPCIIADELTEEQVNLFRLVDNKTSEYSDWDFEKLKNELSTVDLTLDKNQLLLERFELSAEVFDIEPEQAEIRIPTVSTIHPKPPAENPSEDSVVDDANAADNTPAAPPAPAQSAPTGTVSTDTTATAPTPPAPAQSAAAGSAAAPAAEAPKPSGRAPALIQFRFGEVQFFISQIELDRLNEKYADYFDSGASASKSFVAYLLEGVEDHD